jgi:hypothetical protein
MRNWLQRFWPTLVATLLLWGAVTTLLLQSLKLNQGHLVYALDDTYIHMAIAKNFARHGVWGVTPYQFTSSSSSPLWTFLLAAIYFVFGVNNVAPLVLNILFATLLVVALGWILEFFAKGLPRLYILGIVLSVLFFAPIPSLIFTGLEHVLQTVVTLTFVCYASWLLAGRAANSRLAVVTLALLGFLASTTRYEGLFAVGVVAFFLCVRRRGWLAFHLLFWSALPLFVIGLVSVRHGWFWLPNSVVLKGNLPLGPGGRLASFTTHAVANFTFSGLRVARLMAVSLLLLLYRFTKGKGKDDPLHLLMSIFVVTSALHFMLASTGWFYRYEAYLVAMGLVAVAAPLFEFARRFPRTFRMPAGEWAGVVALALTVLTATLLWSVGYDSLRVTPAATNDIYKCHYYMGQFIRRYYQGSAVAVNDLGMANFMADLQCTDLHGLADLDVARAMLQKRFDPQFMDALARSRKSFVAIIDDNWLGMYGGTPRQWALAGRWKFDNRALLTPPAISFYALTEPARLQLAANLRDYSSMLPPGVEQWGPYMEAARPAASAATLPGASLDLSPPSAVLGRATGRARFYPRRKAVPNFLFVSRPAQLVETSCVRAEELSLRHDPLQPVGLGEGQGTQPERQQQTMPKRTAQDFTFLAD